MTQNEAGESLKNVVLVMNSSNLLVPPPAQGGTDERTPEQVALWGKSVERIERILPGFLGEAMPPTSSKAKRADGGKGLSDEKRDSIENASPVIEQK